MVEIDVLASCIKCVEMDLKKSAMLAINAAAKGVCLKECRRLQRQEVIR